MQVDVWDPWVNADEVNREYGLDVIDSPAEGSYDAVVVAVAHRQFREMGASRVRALGKKNHVLYEVKYLFPSVEVDGRL